MGRIEGVACDEAIELREDDGHLVQQGLASWGRLEAFRCSQEQIILKQIAQALQGTTDGRLTQAQAFCRARDAVLLHEDQEVDEQIEVGLPQMC